MGQNRYSDGSYIENNPDWHIQDSPWKAQQILQMLQRHHLTPKTVCEVGCGAGEVLRQLQLKMPADVRLDGYDISEQAIALAQTRANEHLRFFQGDFLVESDQHYDLILLVDVVEHVEDFYSFLRSVRQRADQFIIHLPLDVYVLSVLRQGSLSRSMARYGHVHFFTVETAKAALNAVNYDIVDYFFTPTVDLPNKSLKARLVEYPRRMLYALSPELAAKTLGGYSLLILAK